MGDKARVERGKPSELQEQIQRLLNAEGIDRATCDQVAELVEASQGRQHLWEVAASELRSRGYFTEDTLEVTGKGWRDLFPEVATLELERRGFGPIMWQETLRTQDVPVSGNATIGVCWDREVLGDQPPVAELRAAHLRRHGA